MAVNAGDVLDLSKEQIQRLRRGWKPTELQEVNASETLGMLLQRKEDLESKIRMYEGDDPLDPYYNYVIWLDQNYLKMGRDYNLMPVIEDILIKFKEHSEYKQDIRFVQLLVKYIMFQPTPLELYQIVYQQGLGTMCSLLYTKWAEELNRNDELKKADQVYQLGINCQAQPLGELQDAHIKFQLGIARRVLEGNIKILESTENASTKVLSAKVKSDVCDRESTEILSSAQKNLRCRNFVQDKFKVYEEEENIGNYIKFESKSKYFDLPVSGLNDQENRTNPGKLSQVKEKQLNTTKTIAKSGITGSRAVLEECEKNSRISVSKRKKDEFKCPIAILEPEDSTKKPMYPKKLVYAGGKDIQLEEIRAAYYWKKIEEEEHAVEEPINLTKSSNASVEHKLANIVFQASNISHRCASPSRVGGQILKRTSSDSYLTKSVTEDHSWFLQTDFIKPVILSQAAKAAPTESVMRKYPSESRLQTEPSTLKRKSDFMDTRRNTQSLRNENSVPDYGRRSEMFCPKERELQTVLPKLQKVEDEVLEFGHHSGKGNSSIFHHSPSCSMTVNTREVLNMVDNWWRSPSAPGTKIDKSADDLESFKKPVSRKSQHYNVPVFHDDVENNFNNSSAQFPGLANKVAEDHCQAGKSDLPFHIYMDESVRENNSKLEIPTMKSKNSLVDSGEKKKYSVPAASYENNGNQPLVSQCGGKRSSGSGGDLSTPMNSLKISAESSNEPGIVAEPLIIPMQLHETPRKPEDKENLPPQEYLIPMADMLFQNYEQGNEVFDESCSTKAFSLHLPSSTPFARAKPGKRSRRSSIFNGSYILEDGNMENNLETKEAMSSSICANMTQGTCRNPTNLSLILENSKEHASSQGYSSSAVNVAK